MRFWYQPSGKLIPSLTIACGLLASGGFGGQDNLIVDASFQRYRESEPGPWELRFGHKGGDYPDVRPSWQAVSRVDEDTAKVDRYLSIEKEDSGAGAVLVGQRVQLPTSIASLGLSIRYQCFCSSSDRSGIISLSIFSPGQWDSLPKKRELADRRAPEGDIFHAMVKRQGDDVTRWTRARVSPEELRSALEPHAGEDVVVAVSFLTWHSGSTEWAKLHDLRLGPPLPFIEPAAWPRYIYREEPVTLRVEACTPEPEDAVILRYRPANSDQAWQEIQMEAESPTRYGATLPASNTDEALDVQAMIRTEQGDDPLETAKETLRLTQRPDHPNLFFSSAELERMREKVEEFDWARAVFERVKKNADRWLTREFKPKVISGYWWHHYNCQDCGARLSMEGPHRHVCRHCDKVWDNETLYHVYWSKVHGEHAQAARDLGLTYQITGEEKYARRAVEFLLWYADHYAEFSPADKGGKVVSQTLDECVWLLKMMSAADLAYPAMTREEARHIERDLILAGARYTRKYRGGIHNIRCWHNAAWASAGYFVGDPELVEFARDAKNGFIDQMEQGVLEDGMWYERSMGYHRYTVSAITYHLKAAMHAGDDLYRMPAVRKLLTFPLKIAFPNLVTPSLNDGGFNRRPIGTRPLELAAAWYDDPTAISALSMLRRRGTKRHSMAAWQFGEALPDPQPYTPPPSMDLGGAGLAVLRRGRGETATCAMLEYGEHGGGHGHPDKLQLILYGLGRQLCPDLGTTGYANPLHAEFYKTTPAHNTVTVGGRNMAARGGQLLDFVSQDRYAAAVARSEQVYPDHVLTRRVLLADTFLVDEFIVEGDAAEEPLDWFLRADGDLSLSVNEQPIRDTPPAAPYTYFENLRGAETDEDWSAVWRIGAEAEGDDAPRLIVTMRGESETQVARAMAPGPAGSAEKWGTLRVRRHKAANRFLAVYQMLPADAQAERVSFDARLVQVGGATVNLGQRDQEAPVLLE
ncbi:MAG: heparinase II/III domain-containing protein [Planctomycetota bacterium]